MKKFFQCVHCETFVLVKEKEGSKGLLDILLVSPQNEVTLNKSGIMLKEVPQICINCGKNGVVSRPNHEIGSMIGPVLKELVRRKLWAP